MLIDELNNSLKQYAVTTTVGGSHGGGSEVTETGLQLIALYRSIEQLATKAAQADIEKMLRLLKDC